MDFIIVLYALLLIVGGILGFSNAGSTPSLLCGVLFGVLALYGGQLIEDNRNNVATLVVTSIVVFFTTGSRYSHSRIFIPIGILTLLSLVIMVIYGSRLVSRY